MPAAASGHGPAIAALQLAGEAFQRGPACGERALRSFAVAFAVLLHVALLYAVSHTSDQVAGAGGTVLDAISVEVTLVPASALESRAQAATTAMGASQAVESKDGVPESAAGRPQTEPKAKEEPEQARKSAAADEVTPSAAPQPGRREERVEEEAATPPRSPAAASPAGGATARAQTPDLKPSRGAAMASAGVVRDYANRVLAALNRAKPRGTGLRGTVRLSFSVGAGGEIESVRILKSSGNDALDGAAVAAVRRADLPAPPAGLSAAQRLFELPYQFR
jgi:protein TonB